MLLVRLAPALVGAALLFSSSAHAQAAARHYDCTKAGNANKAACKGAAAAAAPAAAPVAATKTTTTRNYDCSKAGNANKAVCKSAAKAPAAAPAPAPVAASATRTTATHTMTSSKTTATNSAGPNGATAQCKDGTYSKSTHRSGTCAGHKGVATWY